MPNNEIDTSLFELTLEDDLAEKLDTDDFSWQAFIDWARENPSDSMFPEADGFITYRGYRQAVLDWIEKNQSTFLLSDWG